MHSYPEAPSRVSPLSFNETFMEKQQAKRRRVIHERGEADDYLPGNIVEIELRSFMTYDYLRCVPAPRLNLVIGPNGSGKSSLVCAIALGLAGDPQILGRASSIGAFVKRGEESGHVKISLRGSMPGETIEITRKIDAQNKSDWLLNGASVPKRDIVDVISKFNIQVNNLTQFLPQDRVCEFAKLTPIQLLEETQKAIGDPELHVQHHTLIERSQEFKKLELSVKQNEDSLNQLKSLNEDQEKDVERVRQREQLLEKVYLMKKKLPWLRYDIKKMEYIDAQKVENEAKEKLTEAAKCLNKLSAPVEEKKQLKAEQEKECKKLTTLMSHNAKKCFEAIDFEKQLSVQVHSKFIDMEEKKRQEECRQEQINKAATDLATLVQEWEHLPVYDHPKNSIEKLNAKIMELEVEANQKRMQKTEKENLLLKKKSSLRQCLDRLNEMENKTMKILQALRNSGTERIFEAYDWLQAHRDELRKDVYGPILLEVNVDDRVHAAYLEGQVPHYIWKSVITQDPADRDLLVHNLKSFGIPVLNYVKDGGQSSESTFDISDKMRDLGIYSRLDQIFLAPAVVREVLISQTSISNSYIGTHVTDEKADEVAKIGILDFWTPESHYRWTVSRYGGHTSASVEPVRSSKLFLDSSDGGDLERLKSRKNELEDAISFMEEGVKSLQLEQRKLEDGAAILHKEREELVNKVRLDKKKRSDLENRIDQRRRKLESMKNEGDLESINAKILDEVAQLNKRRFQLAMQIKNLLVNAVSQRWSLCGKRMSSIETDVKMRELEDVLKIHEKEALQASAHFERCKKESEDRRRELLLAKEKAESVALITDQLAHEFLQMPSTVDELEIAIQDTMAQANSILFVNQSILEEYESRQKKIDALSARLENDKNKLSLCLSAISSLKDKWLPTIRSLVEKINETFSRNFQEMAIAGEVSLDEHQMNFDKYGILIKVKFRQAGQLQVLSAHHQSGGERSVSTILYLVSLQDLTNCPFRVVDEINQGMDLINERKMFQQLVRAATQYSTPQCFLLTPKLLDDLEYGDACSILNIMNGPWIKGASEVWKSGTSWRAITGLEMRD